jgi:heavy metal sensor kinase
MRIWRSVRVRIIALYMAILLLSLTLFSFVLFHDLERMLKDDIDRLLEFRAQGVADSVNTYWEAEKLEAAGGGMMVRSLSKIDNANFVKIAQRWVMDRTDDPELLDIIVQIFDVNGGQIASSKTMPEMYSLPPDAFRSVLWGRKRVDESPAAPSLGNPVSLRALTIPVVENQRVAYIVRVLSPLTSLDFLLRDFKLIVFILFPFAVVLSGVIGSIMARVTLRPINRMIETIHAITGESLRLRLTLPESKDEVRRLADTFNDMLTRLEQAFTSQRLFIEDLAHELKTPLAVLKGELEVTLKRMRSAREYESVVTSSLEEVDRIIGIVEDLLVLARLEKGVAALDKEGLDAGELVAQCVEDIRVLAEPKGISVRFESKDGTNVRGDSVKLRQLFLNVLDNAIKYTPPGGEVDVEVVREEEWVKITVRDTGPGIPEEDLPRIFGRFFRGQGHGREKGFGLGLPIAKAIAEAHGGRIEVSIAAGGGACFDMFLPIRPPARFSAVSGDPAVPRKH